MFRQAMLSMALGSFGAMVTVASGAVVAPYSNDFSGSVTDFTLVKNNAAASDWVFDASAGTLGHASVGVTCVYSAAVAVANANPGGGVANASDFSVGGSFSLPVLTNNGHSSGFYVGLAAQRSVTNFQTGTGYSLRNYGSSSSQLQIWRGAIKVAEATGFQLRNFHTDVFEMTFEGDYDSVAGTVTLTGTLSNVTDNITRTVTFTDTTPLVGQFFGINDQGNTGGNPLNVAWSSFDVALVPEPAAGLVLGATVAVTGLMSRRRLRR